jgi:preprotein translocase subunit SecG
MLTLAKVLLVIVCITLIIAVLLQSGRSAGLGGLAGGTEQMMGRKARGLDAVMAKITAGLATAFILLSLWVAWLVSHSASA